ncbi:hypothetical protein ALC56_11839 [Trachymyrmex septentrionalis]|uniref:Uncharacterized protein n=1 Tax=Trachymyrmex septentrionalis TaxID=34720 RepID=A0A151JTR0_9HYME|nr:hypothetical protein ALC56_11839 [Trachymyrmex septentrionalis]
MRTQLYTVAVVPDTPVRATKKSSYRPALCCFSLPTDSCALSLEIALFIVGGIMNSKISNLQRQLQFSLCFIYAALRAEHPEQDFRDSCADGIHPCVNK